MSSRLESLPKGVQKLVKRLARIEREQLKVLRAGYPDEEARMMDLIDKGNRVTEELFDTRFAFEELGVCDPDSPDDLLEMGEYFLGLYALDRVSAEEDGKQFDEDLFYAGAHLRQAAETLTDGEIYQELDDLLQDEDELDKLLDSMIDTFGEIPESRAEGKIVPLFGEMKDKKE